MAEASEHIEVFPLSEREGTFELSPAERQLLEVLTAPSDLQAEWQRRYTEIVDKLATAQLGSDQQILIGAAADRLAWMWFGKEREPLPPTMAMYAHKTHYDSDGQYLREFKLTYSPNLPGKVDPTSVENVLWKLLEPVVKERDEFFDARLPAVTDAVEAVLRESPEYHFMRSLLSEQPQSDPVPLTLYWRSVREGQINSSIRSKYGIGPDEPIEHHEDARSELRRELHRLDEETMPKAHKKPKDTYDRVTEWILQEAKGWLLADEIEEYGQIVGLTVRRGVDEKNRPYANLMGVTASGHEISVEDTIFDWSTTFFDEVYRPYNKIAESQFLLAYFVIGIYIDGSRDVEEIIEKTIRRYAYGEAQSLLSEEGGLPEDAVLGLLRPQGIIYDEKPNLNYRGGQNLERDLLQNPGDDIHIESPEILEHLRRLTAGIVTHRDTNSDVMRLLIGQYKIKDYPEEVDDYDLALEMRDSYYIRFSTTARDQVPFIPGFELVAGQDNRWYFKRTEDDPYKGAAEITVDRSGIAKLVEAYQAIGLDGLAQVLTNYETIGIVNLVNLIVRFSDYTLDQTLPRHFGHEEKSALSAFTDYVTNGRLQVQCTGASAFLSHSLELALPDSQALQISGHVISERDRIDEVGHSQTLLVYQGKQYILDATPDAPVSIGVHSGRWDGSQTYDDFENLPRSTWSKTREESLEPEPEQPTDYEIFDSNRVDELLIAAAGRAQVARRERVERTLQAFFGVQSQDLLYKRIVGLKPADPLRRAVEAVVRIEEEPSASTLRDAVDYLHNYANTDHAIRLRLRVPDYSDTLINSLIETMS